MGGKKAERSRHLSPSLGNIRKFCHNSRISTQSPQPPPLAEFYELLGDQRFWDFQSKPPTSPVTGHARSALSFAPQLRLQLWRTLCPFSRHSPTYRHCKVGQSSAQAPMPKLAGTVANKAWQAERSASCLAPVLLSLPSACELEDWAAQLCQLCIGQSESMVATGCVILLTKIHRQISAQVGEVRSSTHLSCPIATPSCRSELQQDAQEVGVPFEGARNMSSLSLSRFIAKRTINLEPSKPIEPVPAVLCLCPCACGLGLLPCLVWAHSFNVRVHGGTPA